MFAALNSFLTRAVSGYFLNKSLRFRSSASAYLNRTPSVAGSSQKLTWSGWVKRGTLSSLQYLYSVQQAGTADDAIYFSSTDTLAVTLNNGTNSYTAATSGVFRDPAAWYHVIVAIDTTQATQADRVAFYINGSLQAQASNNIPSAYTFTGFDTTKPHNIARYVGATDPFDGELAEVNFVDGQALAPTAFGATGANSQWLPKAYAGTYGTNGFYLPFNATSATSYAGSFNGSTQYLNVNSVTAVGTGDFTVEAFVYFNALGDAALFQLDTAGLITNWSLSLDATANKFRFFVRNDAATTNADILSSAAAVTNQWYHVAGVVSGTTATLYVNGISVANATLSGVRTGTGTTIFMGQNGASGGRYLNGYMSNNRYVKGTAVYTANFIPPTANLTNITNTVLLTLQNATIVDNSSNGYTVVNNNTVVTSVQSPFLNPTVLVADSSGNANNWTPNNISLTAGSTYDSLTDVPTLTSTTVANYAVLNPLDKGTGLTLSNANSTYATSGGGTAYIVRATVQIPATGKYYWEATVVSGTPLLAGIATANANVSIYLGQDVYGWGYYTSDGKVYNNNATLATYSTATTGDVIGLAFSSDAQTFAIYKNNTVMGTLTGFTLSGTYFPAAGSLTSGGNFNFGQQPFTYTPPSGFLPLNTFNI